MRVPPFERFDLAMRSAGIFVLGMIVGAAVYNGMFQARFESLVTVKGELESRIEQYEQDLKQLNRFKHQHSVIKSVQAVIENGSLQPDQQPIDAATEAALKKRIQRDLSVLIGQSIYGIDEQSKLARTFLHRKEYKNVNNADYVVEIRTILLLDNILKVWVSAEPAGPE